MCSHLLLLGYAQLSKRAVNNTKWFMCLVHLGLSSTRSLSQSCVVTFYFLGMHSCLSGLSTTLSGLCAWFMNLVCLRTTSWATTHSGSMLVKLLLIVLDPLFKMADQPPPPPPPPENNTYISLKLASAASATIRSSKKIPNVP